MIFLRVFAGVDGIAVDDEAVEQKFRCEVDKHGAAENDVFVPADICEGFTPPSGKRREDEIIERHLKHGFGDIGRRFECKSSVYREIIKHRKRERNEITRPVG